MRATRFGSTKCSGDGDRSGVDARDSLDSLAYSRDSSAIITSESLFISVSGF
jgi:hypothetical protein